MVVEQVKHDFAFLDEDVLAVVVFGSHATESPHERSDVDVCIVAPMSEPYEVMKQVWSAVNTEEKGYDVHVFEELSLAVKHAVIKDHVVVFSQSRPMLEEYFYRYRKLWADQSKARGAM